MTHITTTHTLTPHQLEQKGKHGHLLLLSNTQTVGCITMTHITTTHTFIPHQLEQKGKHGHIQEVS